MPDVIFQEPRLSGEERGLIKEKSGITAWVIRTSGGLIKTDAGANAALILFVIIALALSFYLFVYVGQPNIPQAALQNPQRGLPLP